MNTHANSKRLKSQIDIINNIMVIIFIHLHYNIEHKNL